MIPAESMAAILRLVRACYPSFALGADVAEAWSAILADCAEADVQREVLSYCRSSAEFPPKPGQIRDAILRAGDWAILSWSPHEILDEAKRRDGVARKIALSAGALEGQAPYFYTPHPDNDPKGYSSSLWRVKDYVAHLQQDPGRRMPELLAGPERMRELDGAVGERARALAREVGVEDSDA